MKRIHSLRAAIATVLVVVGMALAGTSSVTAAPAEKVVVCKYVSTPGESERLQTGQNPIVVSANALEGKGFDGTFPFEFSDAQGRSVAIRYATSSQDGDISECPGYVQPTPSPSVAPTPSPSQTPSATPSPSPTESPTASESPTPSSTPSATSTPVPSGKPTPSTGPSASPKVVATPPSTDTVAEVRADHVGDFSGWAGLGKVLFFVGLTLLLATVIDNRRRRQAR